MSTRRRLARALGAVVAAAAIVLTPVAAQADYSFYRTAPHIGACWNRVTAYGGVYQVSTMIVNDTAANQTGRIMVYRPGVGVTQDQSWTAAPGEWKPGPVANVAIVPGDEFNYFLNGVRILQLPQNGIPFYMSHCQVTTSTSAKINSAVSYGLAQFGAYYTGCWGDAYRKGAIAPTNMTFDGRNCGQTWVYALPAGGKGFDCSGLMFKMFEYAGVYFPYDSTAKMVADAKNVLDPVARSQILPGDLLLKSGHVGMYVGNNLVLEASPDHAAIVQWVSGSTRQVAEAVQLTNISYFPSSSYTVQRVRGT